MTSDDVFVNNVWKKYNDYKNSNVKEKFFESHQYKNSEVRRCLCTITSFILGSILTTGIVYAGVIIYDYTQKSTTTNWNQNIEYEYNQDMLYSDGFYYKKIYSYNDYENATQIWNNLIEMQEKDFENSFVIIIAGENYDTTNLYISSIYNKDEKMYIDLKSKNEWNENNTVISAKISKKLDKDFIKLNNIPNQPNTPNEYLDIKNLSNQYTIEDAINDGCFVVKNNEIISDNKKQLDNFINNCKLNVECFLRIYKYEYGIKISIFDIEYKSGKINMNCRSISSGEDKMLHRSGNRIEKLTNNNIYDKYIVYALFDELGNQQIICSIKKDNI